MFDAFDVLLIIVGVLVIMFGMYRRTLGMLLTWLGFYLTVFLAGTVVLVVGGAHGIGVSLAEDLWGAGDTIYLFEAALFAIIFVSVLIIFHLVAPLMFKDTTLPKLGALDYVLGGLLGCGLAFVMLAMLANVWRVAVSVPWQPQQTWASMRAMSDSSWFVHYLRPILSGYMKIQLPFMFFGYPTVLRPF